MIKTVYVEDKENVDITVQLAKYIVTLAYKSSGKDFEPPDFKTKKAQFIIAVFNRHSAAWKYLEDDTDGANKIGV